MCMFCGRDVRNKCNKCDMCSKCIDRYGYLIECSICKRYEENDNIRIKNNIKGKSERKCGYIKIYLYK